ncbi:hypothetical protein BDW02DRAFT_602942 [Decorospora gaudefroyi]|uniref:Protein kinase domain-containing protein n=1 Tax=Decorospora gaudefroyi TaxID=184978 RepID=A0A6A5K323_9PLEO|nr:hypothetical protein BDW02DRAFT_602942 [Decorospora gaudefroyi]
MVLRHGRLACALADFGTCGTSGQSVEEYGIIPGTPGFRAPENYKSSDFHNWVNQPTQDVYGLGLVVFSVVTNDRAPPFIPDSEKLQHDDVRVLNSIKPSHHLHAKLLSEYELACDGEIDGRLATTMAALYAGIIGPPVERPFNFVAKAQWLLKAIELGHFPAINAIYEDTNTFQIIEVSGTSLLLFRRPSFKSSTLLLPLLLKQLKQAAATADIIALNLLVFLGGEIPDHVQFKYEISPSANSLQRELYEAFPALDEEPYFEQYLQRDLQIVDSDAMDLIAARRENQGLKCAYNNDIEGFMQEAEDLTKDGLQHALEYAVLGSSSNVVPYILGHFHLDLNGAMEEGSSDADWMSINTNTEEGEEGEEQEEEEEEEDPEAYENEIESQLEGDDNESQPHPEPNFHLFQPFEQIRFFDSALVLGRTSIVQAFIENGATISPASGHKPSSLHFLARFDDEQLMAIVCASCADKVVLREIMESKPSTGPIENISALDINMHASKWHNVLVMIQQTTGGFSRETTSSLLLTAVSRMHPAPPSVLCAILDCGSDPDIAHQSAKPPLYRTIGTSNVLATAIILSYGASVSCSDGCDFATSAKECIEEIDCYSGIEVYDEGGEVCVGGLQRMKIAAQTVYSLVLLARRKEGDWKVEIGKCVENYPHDCKGKVWRVDKIDPAEATMLLEISCAIENNINGVGT